MMSLDIVKNEDIITYRDIGSGVFFLLLQTMNGKIDVI